MTQEFETPEPQPYTDPEPISSDDFAPDQATLPQELRELNLAIEIYPESASNFLARGDFFRRNRDLVLAAADYREALALVNQELARSRWGFVAQAVRDSVLLRLEEMGLA